MPRHLRPCHRGFLLTVVLGLALGAPATPPPPGVAASLSPRDRALARRLDRILAAPDFQHGFWGVYVYSLDQQRVLYSLNGARWFTPASNAKLFTLAAALHLLGPGYHFHTALQATAAPDAAGVIAGDVVFIGAGDPSLSGRLYPYRPDPPAPQLPYDPNLVLERLARQFVVRGVTRIEGDVIGDDSYFAPDPYPSGWAIGDMLWDYGAPVSALTLNDNTRFLQIFPGAAAGAPARLVWTPALDPPVLAGTVTTAGAAAATRIRLQADPETGGLRLSGRIALGSPGVLESLAVRDPALYAAQLLRQALLAQGIAVDGVARARHRTAATTATATPEYDLGGWDSPPLSQILQATAKESQNLEAELMLRQLGKLRGHASAAGPEDEAAAGVAVRRAFLHDAGLDADDTALADGSGLARQDLVTPAGVVRLLRYMAAPPEAAVWQSLLPVAGVDGTLQHRFLDGPATGRLRAKTGSLSHVNSLSGYVLARNGERLAFSILSNNVDRPAGAVRAQLDTIGNALAAW